MASENFALSYLRYPADPNQPHPEDQRADLQFTVPSFWKTVLPSSTYMAALDPDLSAFKRHDGKLPASYDAMGKAMGRRAVHRFAKLYLLPGVAHCGRGEGPNAFDVLTPVTAWVDSGAQPGPLGSSRASPAEGVAPDAAVS